MMRSCLLIVLVAACTQAFSPIATNQRPSSSLQSKATTTRQEFFAQIGTSAAAAMLVATTSTTPVWAETTPSGIDIEVKASGTGPKPEIGELAAIRFSAFVGETKIDDIFDTPEPYYTRVGSGSLLKGVEEVIPMMKVGDRWKLTIPGNMAFGAKGRPASAGKPRIPGDATVVFEVEMVGLPGKEPELIDLIGD